MLDLILSYILLYKYIAIFAVAFLTSAALPLPATAVMLAVGAFSTQGYLEYARVFSYSFSGFILGDHLGYFLAYFFGEEVLKKFGFKGILKSKRYGSIRDRFIGKSGRVIFFTRFFFTALGSSVNIIAGLAKVNPLKFAFYDISGEFIYVLLFSGLGYIFASRWESLAGYFQGSIAVLLFLIIAWLTFRARKKLIWR